MNALVNAIRNGRTGWATGTADHGAMQPLSDYELRQYAPSIFAEAAHESRSSRYTYIPTIAVVDAMRQAGFLPFSAKQANTRDETKREHTKHMVRFRTADQAGKGYGAGSALAIPEVVLVNSHDGTSSYQLFGGMFRFLCLNGLVVADSIIQTVRVGHKGRVEQDVVEGSYRVLEQTTKAQEVAHVWNQIELQPKEQEVFARAAHALRFDYDAQGTATAELQGAAQAVPPERLLKVRRFGDEKADLWTVFNRVQENCTKGGLSGFTKSGYVETPDGGSKYKPSRRVKLRDIGGIDQDVKLNRALWSLAEGMAALKQA